MIGGLKQTTSRLAIAAAAGMFVGGIALTPAQAADLGGDCCADLEERVAELEATTVRKGNRKVSLKLSGQVSRMVYWWDDGVDTDVYFGDNGWSHSRFRLTGSAKISEGRTAGFHLEHDYTTSNDPTDLVNAQTSNQSQSKVSSATRSGERRKADIWVKDQQLGKLSFGRGDMASNGITEIDLSGTYVAMMDSGFNYAVNNFNYRTSGGASTAASVGGGWSNLDGGSRDDRVRYDTPTFAGFTLSTSVAADDDVDVALRYAKEWNSVRCAMGIATIHQTGGSNIERRSEDNWVTSGSASCIHTPSGLNLTFAAGSEDESFSAEEELSYWFIKGGISRRWNSHGKTSIAVAYGESDIDSTANALAGASINGIAGATNASSEVWGAAIVQALDSAAMEIFAAYQHFEYDDNTATNFEDIDVVSVGGRIKF